jgi:FAD/FMN-containing dehydrogenase
VLAESTADVVAAVDFARENALRLVVRGGGHSYQGTSNAADFLMVWTRGMRDVALRDAFVGRGCQGVQAPQPAVSLGAGALWLHAYGAVTTRSGRYVQGGGCTTVGVAGLVLSGGFGSFSKAFGLAAAGLLEAEVVTADGTARTANACSHPDLFWGLKGGGGGSLGVVTRLTLRTRELPERFGTVVGGVRAASDAAFHDLVARTLDHYRARLFNPHWGEQIAFGPGNRIRFAMVCQGLDDGLAQAAWSPFLDWLAGPPPGIGTDGPFFIATVPARHFWDAGFIRRNIPTFAAWDERPGAPEGDFFWAGDGGQVGQFLHAYRSAWLPAALLRDEGVGPLADALFAASRHWPVALHVNKGLAGAPAEVVEAARDTAVHPAALDAFALAISSAAGPPAYPGLPGREPDLAAARRQAAAVGRAMEPLLALVPEAGSYLAEGDYFEPAWQRRFWGPNHPRLAAVKRRYDPDGLFFVHHGVGSEAWGPDGFDRLDGAR